MRHWTFDCDLVWDSVKISSQTDVAFKHIWNNTTVDLTVMLLLQ